MTEKEKRKRTAKRLRTLKRDKWAWRRLALARLHANRYRPKVLFRFPNGDAIMVDPPLEDLSEL